MGLRLLRRAMWHDHVTTKLGIDILLDNVRREAPELREISRRLTLCPCPCIKHSGVAEQTRNATGGHFERRRSMHLVPFLHFSTPLYLSPHTIVEAHWSAEVDRFVKK